jgi:phosphoenolpyruvate-protein kinase (PTS system EI component)
MTPEQIEAILESNSKAIASNSDTIAEVRRQTQTQINEIRRQTQAQVAEAQRQISAVYQLNAELIRDRATMLEILQGLNDDRIRTSENLASLAENVARIANALEQREE